MSGLGRIGNTFRRRKLMDSVLDQTRTCWLCGQPVDPSLRGVRVALPNGKRPMHPMAPVLDEATPRSLGGDALDAENVRLAHYFCNAYRGPRLDVDAVRAELELSGGARAAFARLVASAARKNSDAPNRSGKAADRIAQCRPSGGW